MLDRTGCSINLHYEDVQTTIETIYTEKSKNKLIKCPMHITMSVKFSFTSSYPISELPTIEISIIECSPTNPKMRSSDPKKMVQLQQELASAFQSHINKVLKAFTTN